MGQRDALEKLEGLGLVGSGSWWSGRGLGLGLDFGSGLRGTGWELTTGRRAEAVGRCRRNRLRSRSFQESAKSPVEASQYAWNLPANDCGTDRLSK